MRISIDLVVDGTSISPSSVTQILIVLSKNPESYIRERSEEKSQPLERPFTSTTAQIKGVILSSDCILRLDL